MIREQIVQAALTWVDTPYHHHARVKGVGVDCAQLVVGVALELGLMDESVVPTIPNYPIQWHLHNNDERLLSVLEFYGCVKKEKVNTKPGDIITFRFGRVTSHLGIMINDTQCIHARYDSNKVVINTLSGGWDKRWTETYLFPGVTDNG